MSRGDLTDEQWERINPHLPPEKTGKRGGQWKDHRTVLNGILWIIRTGAPWRDMPERYGPWQTCHDRLTRWQRNGLWTRLLQIVQAEADEQNHVDWEGCAVDSTSIKAHPHAAGAPRPPVAPSTEEVEKRGKQASRHKSRKPPRPVSHARIRRRWGAAGAG